MDKKARQPNFKCPIDCSERFFKRDQLRKHIEIHHDVKIEVCEEKFKSFEDFLLWKQNMEQESKSSYIRRRRPSKLHSQVKSYYYCSRSTFENEVNKDPQQIDGCCPSTIDVCVTEHEVQVIFWKTHCGHNRETEIASQAAENYVAEEEVIQLEVANGTNKLKCSTKCSDKTYCGQYSDTEILSQAAENNVVEENIQMEVSNGTSKLKCSVKCPAKECLESFPSQKKLRCHVVQNHNIELEVYQEIFSNFEDFELWKRQMEKETKCFYTKKYAPYLSKTNMERTYHYYDCHRSGSFLPSSTGKRCLKSQGSKKINGCCPSAIKLTVVDGEVKMEFWKTHFGHSEDLCHLNLTNDEKVAIACKLEQGIPSRKILNDIRSDVDGSELQRVHLTTLKDFFNVRRDFKIQNPQMLHPDDATSVHLWVHSMQAAGDDSPVAYYKQQGQDDGQLKEEDFQIVIMTDFQQQMLKKFGSLKICMDSTHGLNSYDFQLTTLLTVDEFASGVPVAFCISNRVDEAAMALFLNAVKNRVGTVSTDVFMSDDAPAYYNAWQKVMGTAKHRLLCTWHVDKNWRKNLAKISGTQEKKTLVYKALRVMLQEKKIEEFNLLVIGFLEQTFADPETREFGQYFYSTYANRVEVWAFCHRERLGINTNMYLEAMHKQLKHNYLEGKVVKRVDIALGSLMLLSRDKIFDRLVKLAKKVPSPRVQQIKESHKLSLAMDLSKIDKEEECKWKVPSSTDDNKSYIVQYKPNFECNNCKLVCADCGICVHMYECTCLDNFLKFNICKHIHACCLKESPTAILEDLDSSTVEEMRDAFKASKCKPGPSAPTDILGEKILLLGSQLHSLPSKLNSLDNQSRKEMEQLVDKFLNLNTKINCSSIFRESDDIASGTKIKPQRFYSTKKQRTRSNITISKPTQRESDSIIQSLLTSDPVPNVHCDFDHSYSSNKMK